MLKVLAVDDNQENLYLLRSLLTASGYEVTCAENGRDALEQALNSPPDIAISDILMPIMDGFTFCRIWKQHQRLKDIPFVFYTATYTDPKDEQFALGLGADLFLIKPTEPDAFLGLVSSVLCRHRQGDLARNTEAPLAEAPYLREYNDALIRKLEAKLVQLEAANKSLVLDGAVIESSVSGIGLADLSGICTYANQSLATMLGFTAAELVGKAAEDWVRDAVTRSTIRSALANRGNWTGELEITRQDGMALIAGGVVQIVSDGDGRPLCGAVSCVDVTERRRAQEYLLRVERLESLNLFARGVAHDFNNLLMGVYGNVELARRELGCESKAHHLLETALLSFERARDLTQRLLTFGSGKLPAKRAVDVVQLLRECSVLALSGSGVTSEITESVPSWPVEADPGQLSQVFTNLMINARQAMEGGGRLKISVRGLRAELAGQPPGRYVEVAFVDQGIGISLDVLPRVFDPYFTTKPDGSGLGLATSHAIVHEHGGRIDVVSTPGVGSTFTVLLRASETEPADAGQQPEPGRPVDRGRILVMDDEPIVCETVREMLLSAGYEVVTASEGSQVLDLYRRAAAERRPFDLVLLDVTVRGGMGGRETMTELLNLDPAATIVLSSGYLEAGASSETMGRGCVAVLPKPYRAHELLSRVRAIISQRMPTRGGSDA
jgi:PAS domain S-box-containing protein